MSNPDHWNSLASNLGAEVSEPTPPSEQKKPAAQVPPPRPASRPPSAKPAPRPQADWSHLASELGVAAPAEPPRTDARPPQPPRPQAARPQAPPPPRQRSAPREVPELPPQRVESVQEVEEFMAEEAGEEPIVAELVEGDHAEGEAAERHGDEERTGRKRRRRRRGGRRSKQGRSATGEEQPRETVDEAAEAAEGAPIAEQAGFDEAESEGSSSTEERKGRPKRRRRRGSGRNRDKTRAPTGEAKQTAHTDAEHDAEPFIDDDEHDDEELAGVAGDSDMLEDDGGDSPVDKNSHRAIPAWEEAIGYIVSVNMESRAKNPKSGPPRGRGRGRGNRGTPRNGQHRPS
jgi:hypothetical protein